jgi:uncharacterized protein involved in outer membrane biogenesis
MPSRRMHAGRRWPRIALQALLALAAAVALAEWSGWPFLRAPLQRLMAGATGVPVTLAGEMRLSLIGTPRLRVQHLAIGAAEGVAAPRLADADGVDLAWHWGELWRWQQGGVLRLEEFRAERLDAWLVRHADGRASWHIGREQAIDALPRIGVLTLGRAHIEVDDRRGDTRLRIDMHGAAAEPDGEPPSGGYRVVASGHRGATTVALQAQAGALLPLLSRDPAPPVPLRVEARIGRTRLSFDGSAAALLGGQQLDGDLRLRGPSLAAVGDMLDLPLPGTPPFELEARLRLDGELVLLNVVRAAGGHSRLAGEFHFDLRPTPPLLSGQLVGSRLAFADLGPAVGVAAGAAGAEASGRVLPQREFDLPSLLAMNADVQVAIDELAFGTSSLRPLRAVRTHLRLEGGVLRLDDLRAEVAGGIVTGSTRLDATRPVAEWQATLNFDGLEVSSWVRGLQSDARASAAGRRGDAGRAQARAPRGAAPPTNAPPRAYLTGELQVQTDVSGRGRSTAAILATLDGTARAQLRNGALSHLVTELVGLDVAQALGVAVRGDKELALNCARVDLRIERGVAVPRVALMDNRDSTLRATGRVDLRDERLSLRLVARPKDVSLASLRSPVLVGGTLADPNVRVDTAPLLARAAAATALGVLATPAAAIIPFIDLGDPEGGDPCQPDRAAAARPVGSGASGPPAARAKGSQ